MTKQARWPLLLAAVAAALVALLGIGTASVERSAAAEHAVGASAPTNVNVVVGYRESVTALQRCGNSPQHVETAAASGAAAVNTTYDQPSNGCEYTVLVARGSSARNVWQCSHPATPIAACGRSVSASRRGDAAKAAPDLPAGYSSFGAAKRAMGSPGQGNVYDHVVEQSQIKRSGFAADETHNPFNMNPVSSRTNQIKANFYSTKQPFTGGGTVRDWLTGQSFADQYRFGMQTLADINAGVIK